MTILNSSRSRFISLLRELFQFDFSDLDFGIYRIMNHKRDVIEKFISADLPQAIADELGRGTLADQSYAAAEVTETANQIVETLGKDALDADGNLAEAYHGTPLGKKYLNLRGKAAGSRDRDALEATIFNHLYTFFCRYYQDGDFISKRRYSKRQKYAIPYNGEEVHLHWANYDQYYVKTAEHFHDYTFTSRGVTVHFQLTAANVEQNNVKGDKRFFLPRVKEMDWNGMADKLVIPFEYRPLTDQEAVTYGIKNQQDKIIAEAVEAIPKRLKKAAKPLVAITAERHKDSDGESVSFLEHHLRQYMRANTSDFFIHKDLKGFLARELDFYLKNEVLNLDEMEAAGEDRSEGWFQVLRVIKAVGSRIIDFLDQIESFQKMLWEKRKFVIETQYCITVGTIDESFYPDIAAWDAQWAEWKELFHIDEEQSELFSDGKSKKDRRVAFLKAHPTLVIDTKHLDSDVRDCLVASFGGLDDMTDGLLVHSENFQAMSVLQVHFAHAIKCIYIDPPYNTGHDGFLYKDSFRSSTWVSMMDDRIRLARSFLRNDGVMYSSINEIQRAELELQMRAAFGPENRVEELIWVRDTVSNNAPTYSTNHEYIEAFARDRRTVESERQMFRGTRPGYHEVMDLIDRANERFLALQDVKAELSELYRSHAREQKMRARERGESMAEAKKNDPWKGLYPYKHVEYRTADGHLVDEAQAEQVRAKLWVYREVEPSMPSGKQASSIHDPSSDNYRFYRPLHPETGQPCKHPKRGWAFPEHGAGQRPSFDKYNRDNRIVFKEDESAIPQLKYFLHEVESVVATSVIRQYADGEPQLEAMFGVKGLIDNPKPCGLIETLIEQTTFGDEIVMDFFAGSGTTGHSVINLNRGDGHKRRFVLVEMGQYFDTVLLPRIKKATYAPEWEGGKPKRSPTDEETERSPRVLKYVQLEAYEDALSSIGFDAESGQGTLRFDDYLIQYMLKWETRESETLLNVEQLAKPFSYKLTVAKGDDTVDKVVDLPETFNYLLGLHVSTRKVYNDDGRRYLVYHGRIDHRRIAVIWRETEGWGEKDLKRDKKFVADQKLTEDVDEVFVNGDSFIPNAKALEPVFKARMFSRVEA